MRFCVQGWLLVSVLALAACEGRADGHGGSADVRRETRTAGKWTATFWTEPDGGRAGVSFLESARYPQGGSVDISCSAAKREVSIDFEGKVTGWPYPRALDLTFSFDGAANETFPFAVDKYSVATLAPEALGQFIAKIAASSKMVVTAPGQNGLPMQEFYPTAGFADLLPDVEQACGLMERAP